MEIGLGQFAQSLHRQQKVQPPPLPNQKKTRTRICQATYLQNSPCVLYGILVSIFHLLRSKAKATAKVVPSKAVTKAVTKTAAKSTLGCR